MPPAESQVIEGVVNDAYEAVIPLTLQGSAGQTREIEAVVDTGFNGFLTLPTAATPTDDSGPLHPGEGPAARLWDGAPTRSCPPLRPFVVSLPRT